jgi:hypothetical protein
VAQSDKIALFDYPLTFSGPSIPRLPYLGMSRHLEFCLAKNHQFFQTERLIQRSHIQYFTIASPFSWGVTLEFLPIFKQRSVVEREHGL